MFLWSIFTLNFELHTSGVPSNAEPNANVVTKCDIQEYFCCLRESPDNFHFQSFKEQLAESDRMGRDLFLDRRNAQAPSVHVDL
ncbi:hypothetical protein MUK42_05583 [Musa troglodytarum]|uniref:Uncharacterized protein n=1 Tax=Musa troglodytarum TaxID=320322 RepID=A0A9E7EK39_9LILI|nr:hypothetical protein MUK42_05583 [Musa troglodytarum]